MTHTEEGNLRRENAVKDSAISVTAISKAFNHQQKLIPALASISLYASRGEFVTIVGNSGCGKSTLLKVMSQIYAPDKGKVSIHGKLVPFIELGVGFNPELTGRENVFLNGALLGFSREETEAKYQDIVSKKTKFTKIQIFDVSTANN